MGASLPFRSNMTSSIFVRFRGLVLLFLLLGNGYCLIAQQRFTIVSYNVENLFDTIPSTRWDDRSTFPQPAKGGRQSV